MYGRKITNINRHKRYDPFHNINAIEQAEAAAAAKKAALKEQSRTQQHEQLEERYAQLKRGRTGEDGKEEGDSSHSPKLQRLEWMVHIPTASPAEGSAQRQGGDRERNTGRPQQGPATATASGDAKGRVTTGTITDEEATALRRQLEQVKKEKYDPLARLKAQEERQVAMYAKVQQQHESSSPKRRHGSPDKGTANSALGPAFNKERALDLLRQAAAGVRNQKPRAHN